MREMKILDIIIAGIFCLATGLILIAAVAGLDPTPKLMWPISALMFSGALGYIRLASRGDQS